MKKFLISLCLIITIFPKLHYNDCVRIRDDFYGALYGLVIQKENDSYSILITSRPELVALTVHRELLQKVDQAYCKESQ